MNNTFDDCNDNAHNDAVKRNMHIISMCILVAMEENDDYYDDGYDHDDGMS